MPVHRDLLAVTSGRPRVLILRALGLGDLLTAVPALRALALAFPDHERVLAAPAPLAPMVELIDAAGDGRAVDRLLAVGELEPLPNEAHGAQLAVNLHGRGPQSHRILLASRARRIVWFEHREVRESRGAPRWRTGEHETRRWCRLLSEAGMTGALQADVAARLRTLADPTRLELSPPPGPAPAGVARATVIHPGAASPARRWPLERFARVARAEAELGHPVFITGSRQELPAARTVARSAGLPAGRVLAGKTTLYELACIVAAAGRVVCGDTGVGHLATAFGTPSVLVFGPTPPGEWGPPHERVQHRALWAGRRGDPHGRQPDAGLLAITAETVIRSLQTLPTATRQPAA